MRIWKSSFALVALACAALAAQAASDADVEAQFKALKWQRGPGEGTISDKATLKLVVDVGMLDRKDSGKFLELTGNVPDQEHNVVSSGDWFAVFSFDPVGYVKDDEKIDADALLKQMKDGDAASNEERRKLGLKALNTEGWYVPPHYDTETRHLEWALRLRSETSDKPIINYTVRLLGRTGVESATLVSSPATLDEDVRSFKSTLTGFEFKPGERYSEFKPGDRVAEFGLAALIAGGAAAVAVKTGFWKMLLGSLAAFWKVIAVGAVAVFTAIGKFFGRGKKNS